MTDVVAPEDDELLAAEWAFGLLDEPERTNVRRRLDQDAAFAAAVDRWRRYATALASLPGEPPRPSLWPAIERRIAADPGGPAAIVPGARPVRFWQGIAGLSSLAAAVLLVLLVGRDATPLVVPVTPAVTTVPRLAVLVGDGRAVVAIGYEHESRRLVAVTRRLAAGDRSPELWVLPAGRAPVSLGVLDAASGARSRPAPAVGSLLRDGASLAVSLEPRGGSPNGAPTGPVILTGTLAGASPAA